MPTFGSGCNYNKLKTNLRLTINRLKLLEKKKTEIAFKSRKEIADYIQAGKEDRGRIRVEHIVREDYLVEAMELVESYCDLVLARFGLVEMQKDPDPGLVEAIASIIWASPRLQSEVQELKIVSHQLTAKYGKEWAQKCMSNADHNVSEKVMLRLGVQAPPKVLVERYMMEIAKSFNVDFIPDASVMMTNETELGDLIAMQTGGPSFGNDNDESRGGGSGGGGGGGGGGGIGVPSGPGSMPQLPYPQGPMSDPRMSPVGGFNVPPPLPPTGPVVGPGGPGTGFTPSSEPQSLPPPYTPNNGGAEAGPLPPKSVQELLPDLPSVPPTSASFDPPGSGSSTDFDDLTKRFEDLKRRK